MNAPAGPVHIADVALPDLSHRQLEAAFYGLAKLPAKRREHISTRSVRHVAGLVNVALNKAFRLDLIAMNPMLLGDVMLNVASPAQPLGTNPSCTMAAFASPVFSGFAEPLSSVPVSEPPHAVAPSSPRTAAPSTIFLISTPSPSPPFRPSRRRDERVSSTRDTALQQRAYLGAAKSRSHCRISANSCSTNAHARSRAQEALNAKSAELDWRRRKRARVASTRLPFRIAQLAALCWIARRHTWIRALAGFGHPMRANRSSS